MTALTLMNQTGNRRLFVVGQGQLLGIIILKDLLKFMALKRGPRRGIGGS